MFPRPCLSANMNGEIAVVSVKSVTIDFVGFGILIKLARRGIGNAEVVSGTGKGFKGGSGC